MPGTRKWLLFALLLAGCGDAFTSETGDGGPGSGDGGIVHADASTDDATTNDAGDRGDSGERRDGSGGEGDGGGVIGSDGGPIPKLDAGPPCTLACPAAFACVSGECVDDAETFFNAPDNATGNWSTGWAPALGNALVPYTVTWSPVLSTLVFESRVKNDIEPSFFHNPAATSQVLLRNTEADGSTVTEGMTVPANSIGFHPGLGSIVSIVRWTPPKAGVYAIDATFTGLVYTDGSVPMVSVTVLVDGATTDGGGFLNAFGGTNTATYSASTMVNTKVDFYLGYAPNTPGDVGNHAAGGVRVDARVTAK